MDPILIYLAPIFLVTALVYAMAGQGGGSAYLAILALAGIPYHNLPPIALSCNVVAIIGIAYQFIKAGYLKLRLVVPFIVTSVPAAFIGGTLTVPEIPFKILLICTLIIVSLKLFFWKEGEGEIELPSLKRAFIIGPMIGVVLGLLAGIIGIGGGIFLLPIIVLLRWGDAKQGAIAGGLFTLVNSISGLAGHGIRGIIDWHLLIPLAIAVIVGSQIGAHLGAKKLSAGIVQKVFAALLLGVAIRLTVGLLHF